MLLFCLLTYTIPFDSPLIDHIEYLQTRGLIDIPAIRPYEMGWLISQIDELLLNDEKLNKIDKKIVASFSPFLLKKEGFSTLVHTQGSYQASPELYYGIFDYRLGGRLANNVEYSQAMRIRRASEIDSFGARAWHDFQVYLNEGYVKFRVGKMTFDIGRRNLLLGPGDDNSLLFSLDPQGYDGFLLSIPLRHLDFYGFFSILDASQERYYSVHRIGVNITRFLKLGYSEALLFAQSVEPLFVNFFFPWGVSQWARPYFDANVMLCFDGQLSMCNSIIYGEFLIDDYQVDVDDPYPNKTAYKVGIKSVLLNNFFVKMNYTSVDKWLYTHEMPINTYARTGYFYLPDSGHPLGFPLGNDVDKLSFSVTYMNTSGLYPHLEMHYVRKGEGSIFLPYEEEGGPLNPPFPSGVVEKKFEITIGVNYQLKHNFYIQTNVGRQNWNNFNHVVNDDRGETIFTIGLWAVL